MMKTMQVWAVGLMFLSAAGCVSQMRYDRAVQQLTALRKELNIANAEELALTREMEALQSRNREARSEMLAASDDLQRAMEGADTEHREDEGRFITLQRVIGQLNAQLLTLKDKLGEAKNDTVALKELVAAYQRKAREEFEAAALQPEPEPTGVRLLAPPIVETPLEITPAQPQKEQEPAPPEPGLFSIILDWLLSVWNAIVAFFRSFFP
jgi:hypothetical protein